MPHANAIVFEAPQSLWVRQLEPKPFEASDLAVEVRFSGISTGTRRLLCDGTRPPFPGLGYPLVPARAREAHEVAFGDPHCLKMMIDWKA